MLDHPAHSANDLMTPRLLLFLSCAVVLPSAVAAQIMRPSRVADSSHVLSVAPKLAGFRVGEPLMAAVARLGRDLKVDTLGGNPDDPLVSYANLATGVTILGTRNAGVGVIMTSTGQLDQVSIGESRAAVFAHWGPPAAGGRVGALWLDGDYVVSVTFDGAGAVSKLGIGIGFTPRTEN